MSLADEISGEHLDSDDLNHPKESGLEQVSHFLPCKVIEPLETGPKFQPRGHLGDCELRQDVQPVGRVLSPDRRNVRRTEAARTMATRYNVAVCAGDAHSNYYAVLHRELRILTKGW